MVIKAIYITKFSLLFPHFLYSFYLNDLLIPIEPMSYFSYYCVALIIMQLSLFFNFFDFFHF